MPLFLQNEQHSTLIAPDAGNCRLSLKMAILGLKTANNAFKIAFFAVLAVFRTLPPLRCSAPPPMRQIADQVSIFGSVGKASAVAAPHSRMSSSSVISTVLNAPRFEAECSCSAMSTTRMNMVFPLCVMHGTDCS